MAGESKITITFNRDALDGESIQFSRIKEDLQTSQPVLIKSIFLGRYRTKSGEIPITSILPNPGEATALAYVQYFQVDHNFSKLMSISRNLNVVEIIISQPWNFVSFGTETGATSSIDSRAPEAFTLVSAQIKPSNTSCETIDFEIETSLQANFYSVGRAPSIPVTSNPFTVSVPRITPFNIRVVNNSPVNSGVIDVVQERYGVNIPHIYVRKIFQNNIDIVINANPLLGATVIINVNYPNQLTEQPFQPIIQYSLDGVSYSTSNVFSGQVNGDYTIYIKDSYGCVTQKDYSVVESSSSRDPFHFISNLNSVGFSESQIWNGLQDGIHKNNENVLAMTDRQKTLYEERVVYRESDKIRIQFKSNYSENIPLLEGCNGSPIGVNLVLEKMSNNLNLFEGLTDANIISYGESNELTAIYFTEGGLVDSQGNNIPGGYELNGNLPDFAYIGNYIDIRPLTAIGGVYQIADIVFDSDINTNLIILNYSQETLVSQKCEVLSYYDLLPFEVYEFEVDFSLILSKFLKEPLRIRIQLADDLYDEKNFYTNWIEIIQDSEEYNLDKYFAINYSNNNNRSIFYLYGITHFIRAEVLSSNVIIDDNVDVIKGDLTTYISDSTVNEGIKVLFAEITYKVMIKITLALSSENLFINGLGYVKNSSVEVEPIENTNLYSLAATLLRNGENFNNYVNNKTGNKEGYIEPIYIPGLIKSNLGGYIKI